MRIREYQHRGQYQEGDKVWYQHQDLNAWLVSAEVVYYRENRVWLYIYGNMQKVTTCRLKPFELVLREESPNIDGSKNNENPEEVTYKQATSDTNNTGVLGGSC